MAMQYLGVKDTPAPGMLPGALDALKQGTNRAHLGDDNTTASAAGAPTTDPGINISTGLPLERHHADKGATAACRQASISSQPPQALLQLAHHSLQDGQEQQDGQQQAVDVDKDDLTPGSYESVPDPISFMQRWTQDQLDLCWLQAGQEIQLIGKACKHGSNYSYKEHRLLLRVAGLRSLGPTGEVYNVQVLQHVDAAAAAATAGHTPGAATAAGPLAGRQLCLKVCKRYDDLSEEVQDVYSSKLYEAAGYIMAMKESVEQQHTIMWAVGDYGRSIMSSHMFGSIRKGAAKVSALLMDRGGVSMDIKLQQMSGRGSEQGLSKQLTHTVMKDVLDALCEAHDHGWAYLNIKPGHIVSTTFRHTSSSVGSDKQWVQHALVDFSSALHVTAPGPPPRLKVPDAQEYRSPEFLKQKNISYTADIWAMGILLIELRTGRVPHACELDGLRAESTHQETLQGMEQSPKYATLTQREWAFIKRCMAFKQKQRPTAEQLYEDDYISLGAS